MRTAVRRPALADRISSSVQPKIKEALTGRLFVALSVKSDVLASSRSVSSRAAQTLVLFMISVLIAVLLVAPQPSAALG
jgi:hypothetical protein